MKNREIESMREIDLSAYMFPMIAVYDNPKDYPGTCVARLWDLDIPTDIVMCRQTVQELNEDIKKYTHLMFIPRFEEDDPVIAGVWV